MKNQLAKTEQKLALILQHATTGLAEIDHSGEIIYLNTCGAALLKPVFIAHETGENNLFPLLDQIAPVIIQKIKDTNGEAGPVLLNEHCHFSFSFGGEQIERHFSFTVIKTDADRILLGFDDLTQKVQQDSAIHQLIADKTILQGKAEIAANILHDIGNAVVGFGSYITRIRRSLEQSNAENLQKLTDFFSGQQTAIATVIGEAKAGAAVKMLSGIAEGQKNSQEEINKSITEQLHIITHIQEILNIQRQYANSQEAPERKPLNIRGIITDCMSMLFASIEKRGIRVSVNIPESLPVISGDRTRLMQVILNLVKNSIEAIDISAPEKNISLTIHIQDGELILKVQDDGHGFDEATGGQLFQRGFTTKASGSGLGLDSCRSIIENHNGTIHISSEGFGKGALTIIRFKI